MAFFTIAATGILILTLRSANKTNIAAVKAAEAASEANQIMRNEQRPWLDITASLAGDVTYMPESETIAIPFHITIENRGRSPAFNVAIEVSLAAVPKGDRVSLGGEDQIALNKRLIDSAVRRVKSNNFTVTVFPDKPHVMNKWIGHANLLHDGVADGESFGLIYSVVAAYGDKFNPEYFSVLPGTILHRTQSGLFAFTLVDIKDGSATIKWADVATARLV